MKLTTEQYYSSITFLRQFAESESSTQKFRVRKYRYSTIPTHTGPVRYKPEDIFIITFANKDSVASMTHNGNKIDFKWTDLKLNEWITNILQRIP